MKIINFLLLTHLFQLKASEGDLIEHLDIEGSDPVLPVPERPILPSTIMKIRLVCNAAEQMLPFSKVPEQLAFAQSMDMGSNKILAKLHISRTSATYMTTHGVAAFFKAELVEKLQGDTCFSLT